MKFVFVCVGNTCRSPMVEAIMNAEIKRRGMKDSYAVSCGVMAFKGSPANENAKETVKAYGLDLEAHASKRINGSLLQGALVLCMEESITSLVRRMYPDADVQSLCGYADLPGEIEDPYGCGLSAYEECFLKMKTCIEIILDKVEKKK